MRGKKHQRSEMSEYLDSSNASLIEDLDLSHNSRQSLNISCLTDRSMIFDNLDPLERSIRKKKMGFQLGKVEEKILRSNNLNVTQSQRMTKSIILRKRRPSLKENKDSQFYKSDMPLVVLTSGELQQIRKYNIDLPQSYLNLLASFKRQTAKAAQLDTQIAQLDQNMEQQKQRKAKIDEEIQEVQFLMQNLKNTALCHQGEMLSEIRAQILHKERHTGQERSLIGQ